MPQELDCQERLQAAVPVVSCLDVCFWTWIWTGLCSFFFLDLLTETVFYLDVSFHWCHQH